MIALATEPDGFNINEGCGAVHPQVMAAAVVAHGADMGIALDGDADRLIIADETGAILNGDQLLACLAGAMLDEGTLAGGGVVGTVMTNGGIEDYLSGKGLALHLSLIHI